MEVALCYGWREKKLFFVPFEAERKEARKEKIKYEKRKREENRKLEIDKGTMEILNCDGLISTHG